MFPKFDISDRDNNKIHLIYSGPLIDEANILEILDEFQKIHQNRPEIVLKVVYDNICGCKDFMNKINEYINNGLDGVSFKSNLSFYDECYEISTSDIAICWNKSWIIENENFNKKIKMYQFYDLCILKISVFKLFIFNNINFILNYKNNGYAKRTEYMNLESTLVLINPIKNSSHNYIEFKNNIYIGYLSQKFLTTIYFKNIKNIIISSNNNNFNSIYPLISNFKVKIIYDIRGLCYLSHKAHIDSGVKLSSNYQKKHLNYQKEEQDEIDCINKSDKLIFISECCYKYLQTKYNFKKEYIIFPNCSDNDQPLDIVPRDKNKVFNITYFGSIVPYEGIHHLIDTCNLLIKKKFNIKLTIIGKILYYAKLDLNYNFIKRYEWLEKQDLNRILINTHLVCLPRINSKVCKLIPPLKVAECINKKLPLLAPDYPIFREISDNGKLFKLYKSDQLYNEIKNIYNNGYDLSKLERAKNYYNINMSWDLYKKNIAKFLDL